MPSPTVSDVSMDADQMQPRDREEPKESRAEAQSSVSKCAQLMLVH